MFHLLINAKALARCGKPAATRLQNGARLCPQDQPQRVAIRKFIGLRDALRLVCDTAALRLQFENTL